MKRLAPLLAFTVAPAATFAQGLPVVDFSVRGGYTWSDSFTGSGGQRIRLEGFELGVDVPFSGFIPGVQVNFSPSIFFAGQHRSGGDGDGTVYRLQFTAMNPIGYGKFYSGGGLGWSFADPRAGSFSSMNGYSAKFFVGYVLTDAPSPVRPAIELTYHQSSKASLRGWTVGLSGRF